MKQIAQYQDGRIEARDVPDPVAPPGGILVRVTHSVISPGTERMKVEQARMNLLQKARARPDQVRKVLHTAKTLGWKAALEKVRNRLESPSPLGYSAAGIVIAVDEANTRFHMGDRAACGGAECAHHAELIAVPDLLAARVPENVPLEHAAHTTLCSIAMHAARQSGLALGEQAWVAGQGLIGQLVTGVLHAAGVRVLASDLSDHRLAISREMGAERTLNPARSSIEDCVREWTDGRGADAVLLCAGGDSDALVRQAVQCLRDRGTLVVIGITDVSLNWKAAYEKEIQVRYARSYGPGRYDPAYEWAGQDYPPGHVRWTENRNFESCLHLIAERRLRIEPLITSRISLEQAPAIYSRLVSGGADDIGIVIEYAGGNARLDNNENEKTLQSDEPDPQTDARGARCRASTPSFESTLALLGRDPQAVRDEPPVPALRGNSDAIAGELKILSAHLPAFDQSLLAGKLDEGGEHSVWESMPDRSRVFKVTFPNCSGVALRLKLDNKGAPLLAQDDATPGEYVERMHLHNEVLGDSIRLEGVLSSPVGPAIVISQPLVEGSLPTQEEADHLLRQMDFCRTRSGHWYRERDRVVLADTKMSNFIKSPDGRIHPIDLVVRRPTRQMLQLWGVQELARDPSTRIEASGTPVARLHVVGAGNFARTMLLPHLKGRIELGTVVNATGLSARHVQEKFGFAEAAADVAKIAESSEGAVLIATRHHLHAPLANRFLAEHRHVFVEKPLCISRDELAGLGNAIERTRGSLMAGFNRRFAPAAVAMREMLRETPGPKSIACHVFAGPLPPDHWYANIAESGGRVLGECCHFFDLFGFLLGSPPVRVFAQSTWPATSAVSVPDSIAAQVSYADGSSAQLIYSAEGDFSVPKEAIRVFGAGVVLECENFQHLAIHRGMKTSRRRFASKGHEEEMAAWLGFLREGKAHPLPSSEALASMALTFAALDSVRENRVIGLA